MIHRSLPKLKIPFLENDFQLEVFGKSINTTKYHLICSNKINSEKAVQDVIIPLLNQQYLTSVIIRFLYGYKTQQEDLNQPQNQKEQLDKLQEKLNKLVSKNFSLTNQLQLNQEFNQEGISLAHEMDQLIHIDSKLLFDNEIDENKYMTFSEIKENANKIYQLIQKPILFEQNSNIYLYQKNLEDLSKVISSFVQEKKCSLDQSCLVVNNYKDEVKNLPQLLKQIVLFSIQGSIDFGSEIYHSLHLLRHLMCHEQLINSLLDNEGFIENFFSICFKNHKYGNTIQKLFYEILYLFLYYKKFRTGLLELEDKNKEQSYMTTLKKQLNCFFSIQYEDPIIEQEEFNQSEISDSSDDKSKKSRSKKDKKNRKEKKDKKRKKEKKSKRKKSKKNKDNNDSVLEYEIDSVRQFEQKEDRPDKIQLKNLYQILVKKMMTSTQNPLFFNKLRDTNIVMSVVIYIREIKDQLKQLRKFKQNKEQVKIDFIELIENINLNLRKIDKNLKYIQSQQKDFKELSQPSENYIQNKNSKIIENKNEIFKRLQEFSQHEGHIMTEYISKILEEENLLECILLLLNDQIYQQCEMFNQSVQTISCVLYGFYKSEGGIGYLLRNLKVIKKIQATFQILNKGIFEEIKESDFTYLKDKNENSIFGELLTVPNIKQLVNTEKANLKTLLALRKQDYFLQRLFQTFRIINNLYRGFLAPNFQQELLMALIQLSKLSTQSPLAKQACLFMIKEPYMFETLIQVLKVDDEQMFNQMKEEISITLNLITEMIEIDTGKFLFKYFESLQTTLKNLISMKEKFTEINPQFIYVLKYTELDLNMKKLQNQLIPLEKMQDNFDRFMFNLQNICRYSIVDIETLMANPENFQYFIDREFPFNNKKKFFARYNVYLQHFKHDDEVDSKLNQINSYCKVFSYGLKVNSSLFHNLINENVFDIVDFVVQIAEFIIKVNSYLSQYGNKLRKIYIDKYTQIFEVFLKLLNEGIKVLEKKIQFKNMMVKESQEYENMNLFKSLLRLLCFMCDQNKSHVMTSLFNKIMELENLFQDQNTNKKITSTRAHLLKRIQNFSIIKDQSPRLFYLNETSLILCNQITDNLVGMFQQWGKFPGSFEPLILELIFTIFETPLHREVYFAVLSLLINEPKRIKTLDKIKDNFKKTIKPILFEQVKTKMKSTLILIQKHGSQKGDSIFDLHVTKNGHTFTINFFIQNFVLTSDENLFITFYYFIVSLIEWKEQSFLNQIYFALEDLLFVKLNETLEKTIKHSKSSSKIMIYFKKIAKVLNFIYLLSSSGLFKSLCIYQGLAGKIINLLIEYENNQAVQELYKDVFQVLKIEILNIIEVFMDADIGFCYQKKIFSKSNKYFQEVLRKSDAEVFMQKYLKGAFREKKFQCIFEDPNSDQGFIIQKNLSILESILKSQKMANLVLYSTLTSSKSYKDKISPMFTVRKILSRTVKYLLNINDNNKKTQDKLILQIFLQIIKVLLFALSDIENLQILELKVRKKAVRKMFFGSRDDQKKFFDNCPVLLKHLNIINQDDVIKFQIKVILKKLQDYFKRKSSKEDDKFNVNSDQQNLKQLLTTYTKGYFKYKKVLQTYHQSYLRRLYYENFFAYLYDILVNKFERISLQKNFTKKSFLNQIQYLVNYKYNHEYFDEMFVYELAYYNDQIIYPEDNTIVQEKLNVIQPIKKLQNSKNFYKVDTQIKKLYIEDLLQRNMDIIANKIQSKEQYENVVNKKEDIQNIETNQDMMQNYQQIQQNNFVPYANTNYQQENIVQQPVDYIPQNQSQIAQAQVYPQVQYQQPMQYAQNFDPNSLTPEQYQQYMQQLQYYQQQQQVPAYYAYPAEGQIDPNYMNDPNYQQQYQTMLMQQQMQQQQLQQQQMQQQQMQQQQIQYGNGVQQYIPPQDYYPNQNQEEQKKN